MNKNEAKVGEPTRADMEMSGNETIEDLLRKRGFFDTLDVKTTAHNNREQVFRELMAS